MKKISTGFLFVLMFIACFIFYNNVCVGATINNFSVDNEKVNVSSEGEYPFVDDLKDGESVVRSNNIGIESSESRLSLSFSGTGEISFDYLVSSEKTWDYFIILVDGEVIVKDSGNYSEWKNFKWYSENSDNTIIEISYIKDSSFNAYDDCCYLKNLSFDETLYSPILTFYLDENSYTNSELIYYTYGENEGILSFDSTLDYIIEVKLNGEQVENSNNSFNLLEAGLEYNNQVEINYCLSGYRTRNIVFSYNADLYGAIDGDIFYINDFDNLFYLDKKDDDLVIVSSNHEKNSKSSLIMNVEGSGIFTLDYSISSREDFDYLYLTINGNKVLEISGEKEFSSFSYTFYEDTSNRIVIEYSKSTSDYTIGDDCIYLKNISFENVSYPSDFNIYLNGEIIENGEAYSIDYTPSNIITFDELMGSVSVSVYLNDSNVVYSEDGYILEGLLDENEVKIVVSEEGKSEKIYVIYLYRIFTNKVAFFENDSSYPFIRSFYEGSIVYKSNILGISDGVSVLSYTFLSSGNFSLKYAICSEKYYDLLVVKLNDKTLLEDSGDKSWSELSIDVLGGDTLTISYVKNEIIDYKEDSIYLRDIIFEEKNYTYIAKGNIGENNQFDENTKLIEFDYSNKDNSVLTFLDLKESQEVIVYVNDQKVIGNEGKYYLGDLLQYYNVIRIEYSEDGYDDSYLVFNYNTRIITENDIEYVANPNFVLEDEYISFNGENTVLEFFVEGKGIFGLDFSYFTYDNLNLLIYFDNNYVDLNSYEVNLWNNISYNFVSKGSHRVRISVNSEYFYENIDYLYLKNIVFYSDLELEGLIEGVGSESDPFDFSQLIALLETLNVNYAKEFYNEISVESAYIRIIEGYLLNVNGIDYSNEEEFVNVAFNKYGINNIVFSKDSFSVSFAYINEGLKDTTIVKGFGTRDNPFEIYTEEDLKGIEKGMRYHYILMNDISLSSSWNSLGSELNPFVGNFNGRGFKIINMVIDSGDVSGLFGYAYNANIVNLVVENASISKGKIVGALVAYGVNVSVSNVDISVDINILNEDGEISVVGGILGIGDNSSIYNSVVSGKIKHSSNNIESLTGGLAGQGYYFYGSKCLADVEGTGYVGGISGYSDNFEADSITVGGNVKLNIVEEGGKIGLFSPQEVDFVNSKHILNVEYTSTLSVRSINLFGIGLMNNGIEIIDFEEGKFKIEVAIDEVGGNSLNLSGYIIRFIMEDNNIKYYQIFDETMMVFGSNLSIDLDNLTNYSDNFSSIRYDVSSSKFVLDGDMASCLNVYIDNEEDFNHLSIIINYGVPVNFDNYYVEGEYTSTIGIILEDNLDLSDSEFKGLGLNNYYAYKGDFEGQNYSITVDINNKNMDSKGLINYYSGHIEGSIIENLIVRGNIIGGNVAGLVGSIEGINSLEFNNVSNYASIVAKKSGAFLGNNIDGTMIIFTNCSNYASFNEAAFFNSSNTFSVIKYQGINNNYGIISNNSSNKNIYELFFGDENGVIKDNNSYLNNYYALNVYYSDIRLVIDGKEYVSDESGLIVFPMNSNNLYVAIISNELLKEKEYFLNNSFSGNLLVAKDVSLDEENCVLHSDKESEWYVAVKVTFYDDSVEIFKVTIDSKDSFISSNELIFHNVTLSHDSYTIKEMITLTRYSELLENYKEAYLDLENSISDFKEKGIIARDYYKQLESIYVGGKVSEESLDIYNNYVTSNGIEYESLNKWLSVIVDSYSLGEDIEVIYGSEVNSVVTIDYLDGHYEEKMVEFDYSIEDIKDNKVLITSKDAFVCKNGEIVTYNELFTFEVAFLKRKLSFVIEDSEFEYDGLNKNLNINISEWENKFSDSINNVSVIYYRDGIEVASKIDSGVYKALIEVDITNKIYYDFSEFENIELVIKPKEVEVSWEGTFVSDYDGLNKMDLIKASYVDIEGNVIESEFDIAEVINAGTYSVNCVISDTNYRVSEESLNREIVVNKANLIVSIDEYVSEYLKELPDIVVNIEGEAVIDNIEASYRIVKDGVIYSDDYSLKSGVYLLEVVLNNIENLRVNYNIELKNGLLTIEVIASKISADDVSYYYSKYAEFYLSLANVEVRDKYDNIIDLPYLVSYSIRKDNSVVENPISVGTYIVLIEFAGNEVYGYSSLEINLDILAVEVSVEIDSLDSYYGDDIKSLTYKLKGSVANVSDIGLVIEKEEGVLVGEYAIRGDWENKNYNVTFVEGVYRIKPRKIEIKIDDKDSLYNSDVQPLTYTITSGSVIDGDNLNIVLSREEGLGAGEYVISGSYSNNQYEVTFVNGVYLIEKLDINNIEFADINTVYTGENIAFGVSSTILSDGSSAYVKYYCNTSEIFSIRDAGRYVVRAIISNRNYNTLELDALINITKASNELGYESSYYEYEYSGEKISYVLETDKFSDGSSALVSYLIEKDGKEVSSIVDVGRYTVTASISDSNNNYLSKKSFVTIDVKQKKINVEYHNGEFVYNGDRHSPSVDSIVGVNISYNTVDGLAPVNAGNYRMVVSSSEPNYMIVNNQFSFYISPRIIDISEFEDKEYEFRGANYSINYNISNLVGNDDVAIEFKIYVNEEEVDDIYEVNEYVVKPWSLTGQDVSNYTLEGTNFSASIRVIPKNITVIPYSSKKVYKNEDSKFLYSLSENLYGVDTLRGALGREEGENVGKYPLNMGDLTASKNYNLILDSEIKYLEIVPRPVTIQYDKNYSLVYDGEEKKLEVDVGEGAHVEYIGNLIDAGTYTVRVIIDDSNYCLPNLYEDLIVKIDKKDISSEVSIENNIFEYSGNKIEPLVISNGYNYSASYYKDSNQVEAAINPGVYFIRVIIDEKNVKADIKLEFEILKMLGINNIDITYESFYNKIIMEEREDLEYSMNGRKYYNSNVIQGLNENTNYSIYVRVKENDMYYASEPVVYKIQTTKSPKEVHDYIDRLSDEINLSNLELIKEIGNSLEGVNKKDLDEEKMAKYNSIKENYVAVKDSYLKNVEDSSFISEFMENKIILLKVTIVMSAIYFVIRRKFGII